MQVRKSYCLHIVPIHMRYDPVPYAYEKAINNNLLDLVFGLTVRICHHEWPMQVVVRGRLLRLKKHGHKPSNKNAAGQLTSSFQSVRVSQKMLSRFQMANPRANDPEPERYRLPMSDLVFASIFLAFSDQCSNQTPRTDIAIIKAAKTA